MKISIDNISPECYISSMYQDKTDEELAGLCQQGDASALATLLKRYETPLRPFFKYLGRMYDDQFIDGIISDTFITVIEKLRAGGFENRGKGSFKAWINNIARHKCFHANDKSGKQPKSISKDFIEAFPDDIAGHRPKVDVDPEDLNRLNKALESLPALDQKLFNMRKQGIPYEIIHQDPDFQGFTLARLRRKYFEIIQTLREILSPDAKSG